jgi:hypothetical protein
MTTKILALGKDGKIHCVDVQDKSKSCCEQQMTIQQVNPDFSKMKIHPYWCYECDNILEEL